jgi:hypothetical protein
VCVKKQEEIQRKHESVNQYHTSSQTKQNKQKMNRFIYTLLLLFLIRRVASGNIISLVPGVYIIDHCQNTQLCVQSTLVLNNSEIAWGRWIFSETLDGYYLYKKVGNTGIARALLQVISSFTDDYWQGNATCNSRMDEINAFGLSKSGCSNYTQYLSSSFIETSSLDSGGRNLSDGELAGVIIGSFFGAVLICSCIACFVMSRWRIF